MKAFTDLEQSRKLAEILPLESADNYYSWHDERYYIVNKDCPYPYSLKEKIPCWSLASLLDALDYEIVDEEGVSYFLNIYKEDNQYQLCYRYELDTTGEDDIWTDSYDDFVDACFEMIVKLKDKNFL